MAELDVLQPLGAALDCLQNRALPAYAVLADDKRLTPYLATNVSPGDRIRV
jgi:hypothetical protein